MMTEPHIKKGPNPIHKETHKSIMGLYDVAENFLKIAEEDENVDNYIKHLKKLLNTMEKNLEVLIENFYDHLESGKGLGGVQKMKMEKSSKEIKEAIKEFLTTIGAN